MGQIVTLCSASAFIHIFTFFSRFHFAPCSASTLPSPIVCGHEVFLDLMSRTAIFAETMAAEFYDTKPNGFQTFRFSRKRRRLLSFDSSTHFRPYDPCFQCMAMRMAKIATNGTLLSGVSVKETHRVLLYEQLNEPISSIVLPASYSSRSRYPSNVRVRGGVDSREFFAICPRHQKVVGQGEKMIRSLSGVGFTPIPTVW